MTATHPVVRYPQPDYAATALVADVQAPGVGHVAYVILQRDALAWLDTAPRLDEAGAVVRDIVRDSIREHAAAGLSAPDAFTATLARVPHDPPTVRPLAPIVAAVRAAYGLAD